MPAPIDVFVVAGQSNAVGNSNNIALSPVVTGASIMWTNQEVQWLPLDDPVFVTALNRGSAWPAFGNAYQPATGVPCAIIMTAHGGSSLIDGDWQGSVYVSAIQHANRAMNALNRDLWTPTLRGVLWVQGENDAQNQPPETVREDYTVALIDLTDRFEASLTAWITEPFRLYVFRTGRLKAGDTAGFVGVRGAQDDAALIDPRIIMTYTECVEFADRGWMWDEFHYVQQGYNEMGGEGAVVVAATIYNPAGPAVPAGITVGGKAGTLTVGGAPALVTIAGMS
jgi:hypothetical protein